MGLESKMHNMPIVLKKLATFFANMTLEIYVVQYIIIDFFRNRFVFPINWLIITFTIIVSAWILHLICVLLYKVYDKYLYKKSST